MLDRTVKTLAKKWLALCFLSTSCTLSTFAQTVDTISGDKGILRKMYCGLAESLSWYDLPIASTDLAELVFIPANTANQPIKFPPTSFDSRFQAHVGVRGSHTVVGQIGAAAAAVFLGTRLFVNICADMAGNDVTSEEYHQTFWFYKSIVYTYSLTMLTKSVVFRTRPDGSDNQSFFSLHSSTAFCTASYLSLELNDWYDRWETTKRNNALRATLKIGSGVALYASASYVAYARMHDEKHYLSDVVVGAAVGTIVGTIVYHSQQSTSPSVSSRISFAMKGNELTVAYTMQF